LETAFAKGAADRDTSPSNLLCGLCKTGFSPWGGSCVDCTKTSGPLIFAGVVLTWAYTLFTYTTAESSIGPMGVAMYFIQVALLVAGQKSRWLDWLHVFNFNTGSSFGAVCIAPLSAYGVMGFSILTPFVFFVELGITMGLHKLLSLALDHRFHRLKFNVDRYIRCFGALWMFSYTQFASACFQYLSCEDVVGTSVVTYQPAVHCSDAEYKKWQGLMIAIVVLDIVLGPLLLFAFLLSNRSRVIAAEPSFTARYGIFFESLTTRSEFITTSWQCQILGRRAVLSALSVISTNSFRYMAFTIATSFLFAIHVFALPFKDDKMNRVETVAMFIHVIVSSVLNGFPSDVISDAAQIIVSLLILIPSILLLVYVASEALLPVRRAKKTTAAFASRIPESGTASASVPPVFLEDSLELAPANTRVD